MCEEIIQVAYHWALIVVVAKDCLLTLVKSRLALGSPGCRSFVRLSPCQKWLNTQTNSCWLRPVQPSTPQFSLLQPTTAQFSLVKTSTVKYSPVHPSTAQYIPVQHSTVHYSPPPPVQVKVYHHVYISTLSRQSFAQKYPGLVLCIFDTLEKESYVIPFFLFHFL